MRPFGWPSIVRVGLVQAAIGAVVVMITSVINRIMVVELGWPASIPGALVAAHFAVQLFLRPQVGHRSDRSGRRTRWIAAGMVLLAMAGTGAAAATALMAGSRAAGLALAAVCFLAVGAGASLAGTPLLAMLSERVAPDRRPRAAAVVWLMMIAGFVAATIAASRMLEPFSYGRLIETVALVSLVAAVVAGLALVGLEGDGMSDRTRDPSVRLRTAVETVWRNPAARTFALFIFASMLGYSAQDLILEPFGGLVFGLTPADSTAVSGMHQAGMLAGMLGAAAFAGRLGGLRAWTAAGCMGSAAAFLALAAVPLWGDAATLRSLVPVLGVANGIFAVGAVGSMMSLSMADGGRDAGVRMGVFGAAQAVASALGGSLGAVGSDVARWAFGSVTAGYAAVFATEALLFGVAAGLALRSIPARRVAERPRFDALETSLG